jgi:hypothetical protein
MTWDRGNAMSPTCAQILLLLVTRMNRDQMDSGSGKLGAIHRAQCGRGAPTSLHSFGRIVAKLRASFGPGSEMVVGVVSSLIDLGFVLCWKDSIDLETGCSQPEYIHSSVSA